MTIHIDMTGDPNSAKPAVDKFIRASRAKYVAAQKRRAEARNHFPHDYSSDGRCQIPGCDMYDPTEDDNRIGDDL